MRTIIFWLWLPLRTLSHFLRFVFGHPVPSVAVLTAFGVLFAYMSTIPITPDVQTASTGNTQRIVMMFPTAGLLAAVCAMACGALLMWIGEHLKKPITTWTSAPSIWARPAVDAAP